MITRCPGSTRTASADNRSTTTSSCSGCDLQQRRAGLHDPSLSVTTLRTVPLTGERTSRSRRHSGPGGTSPATAGGHGRPGTRTHGRGAALRLGERGHRGLRTPLRGVEIVGGDRVAAREGAHPLEFRAREIEFRLGRLTCASACVRAAAAASTPARASAALRTSRNAGRPARCAPPPCCRPPPRRPPRLRCVACGPGAAPTLRTRRARASRLVTHRHSERPRSAASKSTGTASGRNNQASASTSNVAAVPRECAFGRGCMGHSGS